MAKLSNIERHYWKHKEDLRLKRRHGIVEYLVTMRYIHDAIASMPHKPRILDIGAGTGRYAIALKNEGYEVKAVELVQHNIDVMLKNEPSMDAVKADARCLSFIPDNSYDITLLLGPLYHLIGDEEKLKALREAKRVTKPDGHIFVAYLLNDYSILTYCFAENRMAKLIEQGNVDSDFHVRTDSGELYDYVRIEDIDRLNAAAGLTRTKIFSPEGAADFMRTQINQMTEENFQLFIKYQMQIAERKDLIGAGSHVVDMLIPDAPDIPA
ncbi:MAG: class I SAM-dependent methyltransferase [Bacteroidaceae bacterium]|nr:class I SAM-dependent methyltransferase [Bacteroidaceae bacterium]